MQLYIIKDNIGLITVEPGYSEIQWVQQITSLYPKFVISDFYTCCIGKRISINTVKDIYLQRTDDVHMKQA